MTDRFVLFCLKKQERKEIEKIIKSVLISSDHQFCLKWPQLCHQYHQVTFCYKNKPSKRTSHKAFDL